MDLPSLSALLLASLSQTCRMLNSSSNILYLEAYKHFSSSILKRIFCLCFLTEIFLQEKPHKYMVSIYDYVQEFHQTKDAAEIKDLLKSFHSKTEHKCLIKVKVPSRDSSHSSIYSRCNYSNSN